jgi:hypothetical protein
MRVDRELSAHGTSHKPARSHDTDENASEREGYQHEVEDAHEDPLGLPRLRFQC